MPAYFAKLRVGGIPVHDLHIIRLDRLAPAGWHGPDASHVPIMRCGRGCVVSVELDRVNTGFAGEYWSATRQGGRLENYLGVRHFLGFGLRLYSKSQRFAVTHRIVTLLIGNMSPVITRPAPD